MTDEFESIADAFKDVVEEPKVESEMAKTEEPEKLVKADPKAKPAKPAPQPVKVIEPEALPKPVLSGKMIQQMYQKKAD